MPYLNNDEVRSQTRELWRTCFGDPEPFLDLYFTRKYTPASNVCIIHERQVVSALQAFLYPMSFYGTVVRVGYLSGVATHPGHRGKGLAGRIIDEAHRRLAKAGALMSFVIPADEELFGFYERHGGYQTAVYRAEVDVTDSLDDVPPRRSSRPWRPGAKRATYSAPYAAAASWPASASHAAATRNNVRWPKRWHALTKPSTP